MTEIYNRLAAVLLQNIKIRSDELPEKVNGKVNGRMR
jgi:hypothetical protein